MIIKTLDYMNKDTMFWFVYIHKYIYWLWMCWGQFSKPKKKVLNWTACMYMWSLLCSLLICYIRREACCWLTSLSVIHCHHFKVNTGCLYLNVQVRVRQCNLWIIHTGGTHRPKPTTANYHHIYHVNCYLTQIISKLKCYLTLSPLQTT